MKSMQELTTVEKAAMAYQTIPEEAVKSTLPIPSGSTDKTPEKRRASKFGFFGRLKENFTKSIHTIDEAVKEGEKAKKK
jgi:hypothetical protein